MWTDVAIQIATTHSLSPRSTDLLLGSLKDSSKKQYLPYISEYLNIEKDLSNVTAVKLIRYLTLLYDRGLGYSAINTARSAISTMSSLLSNSQVGCDALVTRFMKGVFNSRPSLPRYSHTWDPDIILRKLDEPYDTKSFLEFSKKVVFLVTLLSGQRVSTIGKLKLSDVRIDQSELYISVTELIKQTKPGHHQQPLRFKKFNCKPNLCVYTQLSLYINRSIGLRNENTTNLFITSTRPYHNATKNTLSNWIRSVLQDSGLEKFGPHSLRGAATSALARTAVPVDMILQTAGWKSESTFRKFYNKPVHQNCSADAVILSSMV